jgi:hypothetical protein
MSCATILIVASLIGLNTSRPEAVRLQERPDKEKEKVKGEQVGDITGYYSCRGEDANGKQYTGVTMILKKNDIYVVQWTVGLGSTFVGVGIRKGDTLAISWAMGDEKRFIRGVNLYKIAPGPRLTGQWASLPGDGFVQSETLTFLKKLEE